MVMYLLLTDVDAGLESEQHRLSSEQRQDVSARHNVV